MTEKNERNKTHQTSRFYNKTVAGTFPKKERFAVFWLF